MSNIKTYKIEGMDCSSCAMLIEGELEDAGIKAKCSYAKQTLEVEHDGKSESEAIINKLVSGLGYNLTDPS